MALTAHQTRYAENPWRKWYMLAPWARARRRQLAKQPLCETCLGHGRAVPAAIVHHKTPHRGDYAVFLDPENLASLCKPCHDDITQNLERSGNQDIDPKTGLPLDPKHPFNSGKPQRRWRFSIPVGLEPSAIPVVLVCGPPAAGKSTYVEKHFREGDTQIALDECKVRVGGKLWDTNPDILPRALAYRNTMLRGLAHRRGGTAWVVVGAPTPEERAEWKAALGTVQVVVLDTSEDECIARLKRDPDRAHARDDLIQGVRRWWRSYRTG